MHGDVVAAARVIYGYPNERRADAITRLLRQASWADAYRSRFGRIHPIWGDGSLMSVALGSRPGPEPSLMDADYCTCLAQVFEALVSWHRLACR